MPSLPERFSWAMSFLPVKPHHQVLEIGCGNGLLAQLIIAVLNNGFILGIDQSAHAITQASKRNDEAIRQQKARFECCTVKELNVPAQTYDLITAFNTAFLWKIPEAGIEILTRTLKKTGRLCLFYQAPSPITLKEAEPIKQALLRQDFVIETVHLQQLTTNNVLAVIASKKST